VERTTAAGFNLSLAGVCSDNAVGIVAKRIAEMMSNVRAGAGQKTIVTRGASLRKFNQTPLARSYAKIGLWIADQRR
jgi:hypothetical protein